MKNLIDDKRKRIDEIDKSILKLLAERFRTTGEIGQIKNKLNLTAKDTGREAVIFGRLESLAEENGLDKNLVRTIWRQIIDQAIINQKAAKELKND